jgi:hypothetical protein
MRELVVAALLALTVSIVAVMIKGTLMINSRLSSSVVVVVRKMLHLDGMRLCWLSISDLYPMKA